MSIHDCPFAIQESEEVNELQERLTFMQSIIDSWADDEEIDPDFTMDFLHTLYALLEKQLVITTRLRLSDDEIDKEMLVKMNESAREEGLHGNVDLHQYLLSRRQAVREQIEQLTGEDLDESFELN